MTKSAFSLIELIISMTLVILLWVVATSIYTSSQSRWDNTRIIADIQTLDTALLSISQSQTILPLPDGNTNYYSEDSSYREPDAQDRFWVYGKITQDTLPKSYINFAPIDPNTGNYYSYGKTFENQNYEISAVVRDDDGRASAHVQWNYIPDNSLYNLIREHNGPRFVYHGSQEIFPYDPDDATVHGKITEFSGTVQVNDEEATVGQYVFAWDRISVAPWEILRIYFSDGSQSILWESWVQTDVLLDTLIAPEKNNLITQIQLILNSGTIWTNATQMSEWSSLSIQAWDTTAAVRGTIFGISSDGTVEVISGTVEITKNSISDTITAESDNNKTVPSMDSTIKQGIWYLEAGLTTQIIEYDSETQMATLAINDVILADAQYLKVGNDSSSYLNDGSWDSANTWSHDFDMDRVSGQSDVMLAFCKQQNFQEICSRPTALNTLISYDPNTLIYSEEDQLANGDACIASTHSIDTRSYDIPELKSWAFKTLSLPSTPIENGSSQYSVFVSCNDGSLIYEAEKNILQCDDGFYEKKWSCVAGFSPCAPGAIWVYTTGNILPHSYTRAVSVDDYKIENGTVDHNATLRCDNGDLKITQNQATFHCNDGYEEEWAECIEARAQITVNGSTVEFKPWAKLTYGLNRGDRLILDGTTIFQATKRRSTKLEIRWDANKTLHVRYEYKKWRKSRRWRNVTSIPNVTSPKLEFHN